MTVLTEEKERNVEEPPARGVWSNQLEFLLSCLNYAVGLGNVWRFPYLVYKNGGGAFLIPYVVMLFTMGLPIFFLELVVGQYSGLGPNKAFQRMAPLFHGLGYCTLVVITLITIYYQVIIAWTIFYIFATFSSELGWGSCDHDFNTDDCYSGAENSRCLSLSDNSTVPLIYYNRTCTSVESICKNNSMSFYNRSHCYSDDEEYVHINNFIKRILSSEEYYRDYALGIHGATWESWGILRWQIVLCLLLSWIILYLCLMKGVQSSGKAAYFTAFFPYCVLLALLIRGATLDGAYDGIMYYVTPSWESLTDPSVWGDAASQTFYALGIGCGSLVTLSSYNRFNNNCHRDAFFVSITNTLTAILAGFVVFAILGFMAKELDVPVHQVVQDGPGLAFVTYPEAVLHMPVPHLWAILFFIMLFTLGIGSQFAGVEAMNTAIVDQWPMLRKKKHWVAAGTCLFCFILALPMCCSGGVYLFTLMDTNTASWAILIIGLAEIVLVAWVYGYRRFLGNIQEMSMHFSKFTKVYWGISWIILAPVFLAGVLGFTLSNYSPARYGDVHFPGWVDALGWLIGVASLLPLPLFALYNLFRGKQVGWELLQPSILWGPSPTSTLTAPFQSNQSRRSSIIENDQNFSSDHINTTLTPSFHLETDLVKNTDHQPKTEAGTYENLGFNCENN